MSLFSVPTPAHVAPILERNHRHEAIQHHQQVEEAWRLHDNTPPPLDDTTVESWSTLPSDETSSLDKAVQPTLALLSGEPIFPVAEKRSKVKRSWLKAQSYDDLDDFDDAS